METDKKVFSPAPSSLRENLLHLGSRMLPHDTRQTTCPPAPLLCGEGPLIIVPSIMRSGTHLLLDAMFNNFPALRRAPLFIDFDAYERAKLPVAPLASIRGAVIKTHYPQTPLADAYASALATLAARALVIKPVRPAEQVRKSLAKWGMNISPEAFAEMERRVENFWAPFSPKRVEFSTLLDPDGIKHVIRLVQEGAHIEPRTGRQPIMPARTRLGVYMDKILTRAFGPGVPRVNTTIGYRLWPKNLS